MYSIILASLIFVVLFATVYSIFKRYKRCPSDKILVIYGKVGGENSSKCIHGGAAFIWPVFQESTFLDLKPIALKVDVDKALSKQNIRLNVKSNFTIGISTEPTIMTNAAERLLGLQTTSISTLAEDIIVGQLRQIISLMDIEEINTDRDKFLTNIQSNVENELKKIGLKLINVNIVDIKDESGYIDALGKEAAAKALNDAKKSVAEKDRDGAIGEADANQDKITKVSKLTAQSEIGKANAEREKRTNIADANALAVEGENTAQIKIAKSEAEKREALAQANKTATVAEQVAQAKAKEESYSAQTKAELARAEMSKATKEADIIVDTDIAKRKLVIEAQAEAESLIEKAKGQANSAIEIAKGEAESVFLKLEAEAKGNYEILAKQAKGFEELVKAAGGDPKTAIQYLISEKIVEIYKIQADAIQNIKIDKITVWENGGGKDGGSSTTNFINSLLQAIPPNADLLNMVEQSLPGFLDAIKTKEIKEIKENQPVLVTGAGKENNNNNSQLLKS
jgi:flotillin